MKRKAYLFSILLLLGLLSYRASIQFIGDFYWRMAHKNGKIQNKIIEYLEKCIAIDSKNPLFHLSLGRVYLREAFAKSTTSGRRNELIRKSRDEFNKAIDLNPSCSDCHFHVAISYGSLAYPPPFYWNVTQISFKRAIMLNPTDIRHLYSAGVYYLHEYHRLKIIGRNPEKIGPFDYEKYGTISRDNYQSYFRKLLDVNEEYLGKILAKCFVVTERYSDLKGVIRDIPDDHAFLARFLDNRGMWEEAKKGYKEAINLEPRSPIYYSRFASALVKREYYENAIYWWTKKKSLIPRDKGVYLSLANCYMKLKRFDDAIMELRELVRLYPKNSGYRVRLIRTLLVADRFDEAIDEYYDLMCKNQKLTKPVYDSMRYYQKKGDYQRASKILKDALLSILDK